MPPSADALQEQARQLLPAARAGDSAALGRLLELFRGYLAAIAGAELASGVAPKANPSDVVQETFLEAQRLFARFQGEQADELRAWLRAILHNKLRELHNRYFGTHKRQVGREVSLDESGAEGHLRDVLADGQSTPSAQALRQEEADALSAALGRLPEDYRQAIVWRNWEELSFAEIGRRLGRSEDAARMLFGRALERLAHELEPDDASGRSDGASGP
jgi:RNA polymerase sigma-70 factor (ECF subfamily)